jgi:hypothetical protein
MGGLPPGGAGRPALRRFRRNTWKAIALCAALRLVDATPGFGILATSPSQAGQAPSAAACAQPEFS